MKAGIEAISFYVPKYYLDLKTLAAERGIDHAKYYNGLGQEKMAIVPPDEDVVTMGASAALRAMEKVNPASIDTVLFATESGIDQSKSAAVYVHGLLDLPSHCKCVELKQACCSGTAGLLMALAMVRQQPAKKVLLVASDIARYGFGTAGEPTQGGGAVAMVLSTEPHLMAIDPQNGSYSDDVMDFWRPNYMEEALVDGKYSIKVYVKALTECWNQYVRETGHDFDYFDWFCYHLPFTRMGEKAHMHLAKYADVHGYTKAQLMEQIAASLRYNRQTGNLYTASLYVGLTSLLESPAELAGSRLGLFSYGSGCVGMFFGGQVMENYQAHLKTSDHQHMLQDRIELDYPTYRKMYGYRLPQDGQQHDTPVYHTGPFRLAGINEHKRIYTAVQAEIEADTDAKNQCIRSEQHRPENTKHMVSVA